MRHPTRTQSSPNNDAIRSLSALRRLHVEPWRDDATTRTNPEQVRPGRAGAWLPATVIAAVIGLGSLLGAGAPVTSDGVRAATTTPATVTAHRADIIDDLIELFEEILYG